MAAVSAAVIPTDFSAIRKGGIQVLSNLKTGIEPILVSIFSTSKLVIREDSGQPNLIRKSGAFVSIIVSCFIAVRIGKTNILQAR